MRQGFPCLPRTLKHRVFQCPLNLRITESALGKLAGNSETKHQYAPQQILPNLLNVLTEFTADKVNSQQIECELASGCTGISIKRSPIKKQLSEQKSSVAYHSDAGSANIGRLHLATSPCTAPPRLHRTTQSHYVPASPMRRERRSNPAHRSTIHRFVDRGSHRAKSSYHVQRLLM